MSRIGSINAVQVLMVLTVDCGMMVLTEPPPLETHHTSGKTLSPAALKEAFTISRDIRFERATKEIEMQLTERKFEDARQSLVNLKVELAKFDAIPSWTWGSGNLRGASQREPLRNWPMVTGTIGRIGCAPMSRATPGWGARVVQLLREREVLLEGNLILRDVGANVLETNDSCTWVKSGTTVRVVGQEPWRSHFGDNVTCDVLEVVQAVDPDAPGWPTLDSVFFEWKAERLDRERPIVDALQQRIAVLKKGGVWKDRPPATLSSLTLTAAVNENRLSLRVKNPTVETVENVLIRLSPPDADQTPMEVTVSRVGAGKTVGKVINWPYGKPPREALIIRADFPSSKSKP